jgi:hypothetical protein|tara:strand:+ start:348 stop:596 length:249 start_codon:yes stop_codon:yes gene_type:complete
MEYNLEKKEAKNIEVDFIFKLDTLDNHLNECTSIISPVIDALPMFKHLYEPKNIKDYYDRLKRNYESKKSAWMHREKIWQKK